MAEPLTFKLQPKQQLVLTSEANFILWGGGKGAGKAVSADTPVYTIGKGFIPIADIIVGDKVIGRDGKPCNVIAKSSIDTESEAFEVTFVTGETVITDGNHDWLALSCAQRKMNAMRNTEFRDIRRASRPSRAVSTSLKGRILAERNARVAAEARERDALLKPIFGTLVNTKSMLEQFTRGDNEQPNWSIGVCDPIEFNHKSELAIDPYTLGVWLGDGCSTSGNITNGDFEIVEYLQQTHGARIREVQKPKRDGELGALHWDVIIPKFSQKLSAYNLTKNKHIPDDYMYASASDRYALLAGILDSDGYIDKNKAYISLSRHNLILQVRQLCSSLGIKCTHIRSKKPFYTADDGSRVQCKTSYTFSLSCLVNPFRLKRKADLWESFKIKRLKDSNYRLITSIKKVENPGVCCIQVDSPDNTYCITESFIPTHNSFMIRATSIIYAIEVPGISIYIFRKNYNDLIANHVHTNGGYLQLLKPFIDDKLVTYNKSDYSFSFINGSRIQLAHLNNDTDLLSYQGREIQVLYLDESTQFSPIAIMELYSCLRLGALKVPEKWRGRIPRCILATNPGGVSHAFHKERFVDYGQEVHRHPPEWGGALAQFIPAFLSDNRILTENDPNYADRIRGTSVGSPERARALLEGDWEISDSNAIVHWKRDIHVVEPFAIPKAWRVIRGYDYGFSAPYSVLYAAISNGEDYIDANGEYQSAPVDSIFIIAEIYGATPDNKGLREQPSEQAKRVREVDDSFAAIGIKVLPGPADNSIFSKDRGKSIAQFFADEGVPWVRSDKSAGSRVIGLQIINQMVFNATLDTPEGPYLKSFKTCPYFNKQIPALQVDKNKPEDIDTKQNDHSADCLRYLTLHVNKAVKTKQVVGL